MTSQQTNSSSQSSDAYLSEALFSDTTFSLESFLNTATPKPIHTCCCNNESHIKRQTEIINLAIDCALESRGLMRRDNAAGKFLLNK